MHQNCLNRPPTSIIGVNCWCPQHWELKSRGDIKLEAPTPTISVPTTPDERAARAARQLYLQGLIEFLGSRTARSIL